MEIRTDEHFETDLREQCILLAQEQREAKRRADELAYGSDTDLYGKIADEVERAKRNGEKFASLHEAYAVMLEELDEVWDIARQKRKDRNAMELRKELIQLAAMAVMAIGSMGNFIGGKV